MSFMYLSTIVIMIVVIVIAGLAILRLAKSVTQNIEGRTVELISNYDRLLAMKSKELNEKIQEIEYLKLTSTPDEEKPKTIVKEKQALMSTSVIEQMGESGSYINEDLSRIYQDIRDNFALNIDQVVEVLPQTFNSDEKGLATTLLEDFTYEVAVDMAILAAEDQYSCIKESVDKQYLKLLDDFAKQQDFNSLDFYSYLQEIAKAETKKATFLISPNIEVKNNTDLNIHMSAALCEGIQVEFDQKLYDFAIEKKEIGYVNTK